MSQSLAEDMRDDWVALVQAIHPSTYRSNVQDVYTTWKNIEQLSRWPSVCVLMGSEKLVTKDTSATRWQSEIDMMLLGYAKQSDLEALAHDLKRIVCANLQTHITGSDRYRVMRERPIVLTRSLIPDHDVYWISVQFQVELLAQATSF